MSDLAFFPKLTGITESPVLRNDGTILAEPGYDSATGLFYQPVSGFVLPPVPSSPTSSDIAEAAALLQEVFCDFPFDGEASRAGAIASLISSVLRPAIDGPTPLAIVDKPQPGTGASLIANVISMRQAATWRP